MSDYTIVFDDKGFPLRINHYAQLPELSALEIVCTKAQANQYKQFILFNGSLKYIGMASNLAYEIDMTVGEWVLNQEKQAALDQAVYKASIPDLVTMVQAQLALLKFGYLDIVEAYMQAESTPREAKIFWRGTTVRRDDVIVNMMLGLLGLTEKEGDELFKYAATR